MKKECDECKRKRSCNTFDRSRGNACKDFEKNTNNEGESKKQEE